MPELSPACDAVAFNVSLSKYTAATFTPAVQTTFINSLLSAAPNATRAEITRYSGAHRF